TSGMRRDGTAFPSLAREFEGRVRLPAALLDRGVGRPGPGHGKTGRGSANGPVLPGPVRPPSPTLLPHLPGTAAGRESRLSGSSHAPFVHKSPARGPAVPPRPRVPRRPANLVQRSRDDPARTTGAGGRAGGETGTLAAADQGGAADAVRSDHRGNFPARGGEPGPRAQDPAGACVAPRNVTARHDTEGRAWRVRRRGAVQTFT